MEPIRHGAPALWPFITQVVDAATAAGFITTRRAGTMPGDAPTSATGESGRP
jgi:hypothetical protein